MTQLAYAPMRGHHICVRVPDLDAAVRWWADGFGFVLGEQWTFDGARHCYLSAPGDANTAIEIVGDGQYESRPEPDLSDVAATFRRAGYHHYCWHVHDIGRATEQMRSRAVRILMEPFDFEPIHQKLMFFADPWGNVFELAQLI